ncbi:AfsR/SARP family transcriptional regulator [Streptomyces boluensis]|uniref:Transcriptional regulator n=1 Tax=Streptomyces boluensis TaxID=1775135 RepID=A0A964XI80_9ACTN|nr:AfsR/SARP family transcriptional regulator [Streptomyces boluensis]NBE49929.1 transcriptional regulator [Streptomyces boluensis]
MRVSLIGSFEFGGDGEQKIALKAVKLCQLLAVLALKPRETVPASTLIRELWGENPPAAAPRTLQTHIYHARKLLTESGLATEQRKLLLTRSPGYQLDVDVDAVDVRRFERLVRQAEAAVAEGALEAGAAHLTRALSLWRGPLLGDVPVGAVLAGQAVLLEELRIRAWELRVEIEHRWGRHREFLPDLRAIVDEYPLHEWFHGQLIVALHRSGRRGDALDAYQNLYRVLRNELGLEPSAELQRIQTDILESPGDSTPRGPHRPGGGSYRSAVTPLWSAALAG